MSRSLAIHHHLRAGTRGETLSALLKERIPIEPGFIISADAFTEFVEHNDLKTQVEKIVQTASADSVTALKTVSREIQKLIRHAEFPEDIARQILSMYVHLGQPRVALFPSVFIEEGENPLFGHMEDYFFGYAGDANLFEAIKEVWSHFFDQKPLYYRIKSRKDHFSLPFAISVQIQPKYKYTGVLYTNDPTSTTKQTALIKVVSGEGGLIQELDGADYYWIKRGSGEVYNTLFDIQNEQILFEHGREVRMPLPKTLREKRKLSEGSLEKIAKIAHAIQQHFYFPQQCHFGFSGKEFVIIDTAPFTGHDHPNVPKAIPTAPVVAKQPIPEQTQQTSEKHPFVLGLSHSLSSAGHLPTVHLIEGHLLIDPKHIIMNYPTDLSPGKAKALIHEIASALSFTASQCQAKKGFLYRSADILDSLPTAEAQMKALASLRASYPLLHLTLACSPKKPEDLSNFTSFWRTQEFPRSSKVSYAVILQTPAQIYAIDQYTSIGIDLVLIEIDSLHHSLHGHDEADREHKAVTATLDQLERIFIACDRNGLAVAIQSTKPPTHDMLDTLLSKFAVEWILPSSSYIEMKKNCYVKDN